MVRLVELFTSIKFFNMLIRGLASISLILSIFFIDVNFLIAEEKVSLIEIDQPRFSEKGIGQKSYEIKALKGLRSENELRLIEVEGKFKTEDGIWIYMNADEGNYNQDKELVELWNDVSFYTESGDEISSDNAEYNMQKDTIVFESNVIHESNRVAIKSDVVYLSNNFGKLTYIGNVRSEIIK